MIYVLLNGIIEVLIYESIRLGTFSEKISIRIIINSYGKTINLPDTFTFMLQNLSYENTGKPNTFSLKLMPFRSKLYV